MNKVFQWTTLCNEINAANPGPIDLRQAAGDGLEVRISHLYLHGSLLPGIGPGATLATNGGFPPIAHDQLDSGMPANAIAAGASPRRLKGVILLALERGG